MADGGSRQTVDSRAKRRINDCLDQVDSRCLWVAQPAQLTLGVWRGSF
jgi:hypothetical protein